MKVLLVNHCSPGDVLMLTAAVRDLQAAYPGEFTIGIDTYCPELWLHNLRGSIVSAREPGVLILNCHHPPLLDQSNGQPRHYIESIHHLLAGQLGESLADTVTIAVQP